MLHRYRRHRHSLPSVFGYFQRVEAYYSFRGPNYDHALDVSGQVRSISLWFFNETKCWKLDDQLRSDIFQSVLGDRVIQFGVYNHLFFFSGSYVYSYLGYGCYKYPTNESLLIKGYLIFKFTRGMKLVNVWKHETATEPGVTYAYYHDILFEEFGSKGHEDQSGTYSIYDLQFLPVIGINALYTRGVAKPSKSGKRIYPRVVRETGSGVNRVIEWTLAAEDIPEKSILRYFDLPMDGSYREGTDLGLTLVFKQEEDGKSIQMLLAKPPY